MRFYYVIGRVIGPVVVAVLQWYSRTTGKPRVRVVVVNKQNEVLLVRNWAGTPFLELPGGGIERRELPVEAARRELLEETGIVVQELVDEGSVIMRYEARIFSAKVPKQQLPAQRRNRWEIIEIGWYPADNLPADTSPLVWAALQKVSK